MKKEQIISKLDDSRQITNRRFMLLLAIVFVSAFLFARLKSTEYAFGCPNVPRLEPWKSTEGSFAILENGQPVYITCAWVAEVSEEELPPSLGPEHCSLPKIIPGWDEKTLAKWETVRRWCPEIFEIAEDYGLDPELWASVILQESGGWAGAESTAGAMGLAQVMPFHGCARWEPRRNLDCGAEILAGHLEDYNLRKALAAYNAGVGGMAKGLGFDFADAVLAIYDAVKNAE